MSIWPVPLYIFKILVQFCFGDTYIESELFDAATILDFIKLKYTMSSHNSIHYFNNQLESISKILEFENDLNVRVALNTFRANLYRDNVYPDQDKVW